MVNLLFIKTTIRIYITIVLGFLINHLIMGGGFAAVLISLAAAYFLMFFIEHLILKYLKPLLKYKNHFLLLCILISFVVFLDMAKSDVYQYFYGVLILSVAYLIWKRMNAAAPPPPLKNIFFVMAFFASAFTYFGCEAFANEEIFSRYGFNEYMAMFVAIGGLWAAYHYLFAWAAEKILEILNSPKITSKKPLNESDYIFDKKLFFVLSAVFVLSRVPFILAFYPGVVSFDTALQLMQARGLMDFYNSHPVVSTLFIKLFYDIGILITGDYTSAIIFITIAQVTVLSFICSYAVVLLKKIKAPKPVWIGVFLYYALLPLHGSYGIYLGKDSLFSGFLLLTSVSVTDILVFKRDKMSAPSFITFIIGGMGMLLFRHNGVYAFAPLIAVTLIILFIVKFNKKSIHKIIISSLVVFAVYFGVSFTVTRAIEYKTVTPTFPLIIQQIARVVVYGGDINANEAQFIEDYLLPMETLKNEYTPWLADPLYSGWYGFIKKPFEFIKLWFGLMIKNADLYADAFIFQTYGFWSPLDLSRAPIITYNANHIAENHYDIDLGIDMTFAFPKLNEAFISFITNTTVLPAVSLTLGVGIIIFMIVAAAVLCVYKKGPVYIIPFVLTLMLWATVLISTPLFYEMRYIYAVFLTAPFLIGLLFSGPPPVKRE